MEPRIMEMMKFARVPFELNAKPGDRVAIIADTQTDPLVWETLSAAANEIGAEPVVTIMLPRKGHGHEPPDPVAAAMKDSDIVLLVTSTALAHSQARDKAQKAGATIVFMEQLTPDMLTYGASADEYREMDVLGKKIEDIWNKGKTVKVTSPLGTNLTASIEGRKGFHICGLATPSVVGGKRCAFHDGECGVPPVEETGEGLWVVDSWMHHCGAIKDPIQLTIEKGKITKFEGGIEAKRLKEYIEKNGDEYSYYCPSEISIQLNPKLEFTGIGRTDKKVRGGVHIAMGTNSTFGGNITSRLHLDGVSRNYTICIDDILVLDGGEIVV